MTLRILLFLGIATLGCSAESQAQSLFNSGSAAGTGSAGSRANPNAAVGPNQSAALNLQAGTVAVDQNFGTGFVGRSDNQGRFVGNQLASPQTGFNGANRFGGGNRVTDPNFVETERRGAIRYRQEIAFDYPAIPRNQISGVLQTQTAFLADRFPNVRGLRLTPGELGQVTIDGTVGTDRERRLVETFLRMEPGVRDIENRLILAE